MRARIRTIKPEVLLDEDLWDAEAASQLPLFRAFTGLWMYADREGRFEWRPRALKSVVLPYWNGEMERALDALADAQFILRYEVDGRAYAVIRTFKQHQAPNHKEPPSKLPPPPWESPSGGPSPDPKSGTNSKKPGPARESPGKPGPAQNGSLTGQEPVAGTPATSGNGRELIREREGELEATPACAHTPEPAPVREEPESPSLRPDPSPPDQTGRMRRPEAEAPRAVEPPLVPAGAQLEPELEPGEPDVGADDRRPLRQSVRAHFHQRFHERTTKTPIWDRDSIERCARIAVWLEENFPGAELPALKRLLDGFFKNERAEQQKFPLSFLAKNPAEYYLPPSQTTRDARRGFADPSPATDFKQTDLDEVYGPRPNDMNDRLKRAGGRR